MFFPIAIGSPEIAIIGIVVVLLFGVKKLPEIGRSLAEGIHEFKKASRETREDSKSETNKDAETK